MNNEENGKSFAIVIHPVTNEEVTVPFIGGYEQAVKCFEPLGIRVVMTMWIKNIQKDG